MTNNLTKVNKQRDEGVSGFRNNVKTITTLIVLVIICSVIIYTAVKGSSVSARQISLATNFILVGSIAFISLFIILIVNAFGTLKKDFGIYNFFIGDEGTYSLARLQAVLWAVAIMASQISVIVALLLNNKHADSLFYYQASFSESSLWLLGLSLSSYVAVKGITINKIADKPSLKNSRSKNPQWCDILIGDNKRLDFAKCQMLAWTIIALFVFLTKCYFFNYQLLIQTPTCITQLFNHFYEDYSAVQRESDVSLPYVPYLPWTFVVLMGMSQGAYVGKKLVPNFKVDEAQEGLKEDFNNNIAKIDIEISAKQSILKNMNPITEIGILNKKQLQLDVQELLAQRDRHQALLKKVTA